MKTYTIKELEDMRDQFIEEAVTILESLFHSPRENRHQMVSLVEYIVSAASMNVTISYKQGMEAAWKEMADDN
jgi:hypothetical protein